MIFYVKIIHEFGVAMKKCFLLFLSFFFTSCATTTISSIKNPDIDFSGYKRILVFANIRDIDFRKSLESELVTVFSEYAIDAVSSIELISPVKEYSEDEIKKILSDNLIDGYLSIEVIDSSNVSGYVPQTSYTNYQSQYVNGQLISVPYTTTYGGYAYSYLKSNFEIVLKDVRTGQIAFKATAKSAADDFGNMKNMAKSVSKKIGEEYIKLSTQ